MKTDNELIAEFMGFYIVSERTSVSGIIERTWKSAEGPHPYFGGFREPHLRFDSSWEWLMPVVEKIEAMKEVSFDIHREATLVRIYFEGSGTMIKKINSPDANSKITHVYKAVVEFVRWYNTQPK